MFAEIRESKAGSKGCGPATDCREVNAKDFMSLLVSRRRMFRVDELGAEVRGLLDPETGVRYVVDDCDYSRELNNPSKS